jgi:hypothetical protein
LGSTSGLFRSRLLPTHLGGPAGNDLNAEERQRLSPREAWRRCSRFSGLCRPRLYTAHSGISSRPVAVMTPPRRQTPPLRLLSGRARPTTGVETLDVISPELALVDQELATRARALLRTYDGDELVAGVQSTPHADQIAPEPSGDEQTVLSPELALVDPELADRARAQLAGGEPASPAAPVRHPEQPPQPLRPPRVPQQADRAKPVESTLRARSKGSVIAAVIALAAGLGGAAAIWAQYNGGASGSRGIEQAPFQPLRELSPATALSEHGETTTARPSKQGMGGQGYVRRATRSRRKGIGGSAPRSGVRTQTLGRPRRAAFHVPGCRRSRSTRSLYRPAPDASMPG